MAATAHVADYKKKIVAKIVDSCAKYRIIGAVNMLDLPAPQLQKMREKLRGKVELFMAKRRLIKLAIEQAKDKKKGLEAIEQHLGGMPALLFTNENPFTLFKTLKQNKSKAPAKAGQIAPAEITIRAGPTGFMPGPVIGELGALGIKSGVENGKVSIKQDSVVAKAGDTITAPLAAMLTRLNIQPMEVGLDLVAVYEDGVIYTKSVLNIDENKFQADLESAARYGINLAVEAGYTTKSTVGILIGKAFREAKAVGLEFNIIDDKIIDELLSRGERQALGIKTAGNIETSAPKKAEAAASGASEPKGDERVSKMVSDMKKFANKEIPSAQDIINEVSKEK